MKMYRHLLANIPDNLTWRIIRPKSPGTRAYSQTHRALPKNESYNQSVFNKYAAQRQTLPVCVLNRQQCVNNFDLGQQVRPLTQTYPAPVIRPRLTEPTKSRTTMFPDTHVIRIDMTNLIPYVIKVQKVSGHRIEITGRHGADEIQARYMIPFAYDIDQLKATFVDGCLVVSTPKIASVVSYDHIYETNKSKAFNDDSDQYTKMKPKILEVDRYMQSDRNYKY